MSLGMVDLVDILVFIVESVFNTNIDLHVFFLKNFNSFLVLIVILLLTTDSSLNVRSWLPFLVTENSLVFKLRPTRIYANIQSFLKIISYPCTFKILKLEKKYVTLNSIGQFKHADLLNMVAH